MTNVLFYTDVWNDGGIESVITNIILHSSNPIFHYQILTFNKKNNVYDKILS